MTFYTSYWAQVRNFPHNLVGLSTTIWNPKWRPLGKDKRGVICVDCPPFKPGHNCDGLCNGKCNPKHPQDCLFLQNYKLQLDKITPAKLLNSVWKLATQICRDENLQDIDFAFLFYETPQNPCSERVVVQQWFRKNGIEIEEWHPNI
jgi:hypothetical protein